MNEELGKEKNKQLKANVDLSTEKRAVIAKEATIKELNRAKEDLQRDKTSL